MGPWPTDLEQDQTLRPLPGAPVPVFRGDTEAYSVFYAPGQLCVVGPRAADRFAERITRAGWPEPVDGGGTDGLAAVAADLCQQARLAAAEDRRRHEEPFAPECLTLYLNNTCPLACVYCFADATPRPGPELAMAAIDAAAEVVARSCRRKQRPFTVVFQGGGEPTLQTGRVEHILRRLTAIATLHDIPMSTYVATNGVMPERRAVWLARRFDLVGVSCDGPADIQDDQRPRATGGPTARQVERTAHILREEGCRHHVRATITAKGARRQAEIADYLCAVFRPEELHFEPVYRGGRALGGSDDGSDDSGVFAHHFLLAQQLARARAVRLSCAGCRLDQFHGPHCNVLRQVLNLVPGGVATACFKTTRLKQATDMGFVIGAPSGPGRSFVIDHQRVASLRAVLAKSPPACAGCFNRFHCATDCPDECRLVRHRRRPGSGLSAGFRCRAQRAIATATIRETAEALWRSGGRAASDVVSGPPAL